MVVENDMRVGGCSMSTSSKLYQLSLPPLIEIITHNFISSFPQQTPRVGLRVLVSSYTARVFFEPPHLAAIWLSKLLRSFWVFYINDFRWKGRSFESSYSTLV